VLLRASVLSVASLLSCALSVVVGAKCCRGRQVSSCAQSVVEGAKCCRGCQLSLSASM
jgi:hypothetical protein